MSEHYHVRVTKDYLVFSAAHFITFNGNVCERLHGHNYRVAAEVHGPLDENQYVVDFIALRDALRDIVAELDHRMLLPMHHPSIRVAAGPNEVTVTFQDRRWVFPLDDCVLLPVANTTAELLARHVGGKLREVIERTTRHTYPTYRVEVDECNGQLGVWTWRAD
ncbi:MAG: 6-pyruvoyl tetrahydropterin synthase family protein [Pirellulales bacterium]|nr:6-pyruvoyl tetrahydropterin synthase family protein [Pirellulales bacterium]